MEPEDREYVYTQAVLDTVDLIEAEARNIVEEKEKAGRGNMLTFDEVLEVLKELRRAMFERRQEKIVYYMIGYTPWSIRKNLNFPMPKTIP